MLTFSINKHKLLVEHIKTMGRLERLLNRAINFTENGKCEEALNLLGKAEKIAPNDPEVYNSYALTYDAMDNFDMSITNYQKALTLNSKDPHIFTQYGITLCRMGHFNEAILKLSSALAINPDYIMAKWHLGVCYKMAGFYEESLAIFKECLEPGNPDFDYVREEVYYQIGLCYFDIGWTHDALKYFRLQLENNPSDDWALLSIGNCYFDLGWIDESIETFKNVIRIKPDFITAYSSLAASYTEKGWYDEAIDVLREAQMIAPDDESIKDSIDYIESLRDQDGKNSLAFLSLILDIINHRKTEKNPTKN